MLINEVDVSRLSPMMKLYVETKKQYADCILFSGGIPYIDKCFNIDVIINGIIT